MPPQDIRDRTDFADYMLRNVFMGYYQDVWVIEEELGTPNLRA